MSLVDNQNWPLNTILVSQKHKVLYTPVAKNANTTLKRLFVRLSGHPKTNEILRSGIHTYLLENRTGLVLADYTPEVATEILQDSAYFRFIVLREPLKRVISGYLEKFVVNAPLPGEQGEPFNVIKRAIDWTYQRQDKAPDYVASISFNQFVNYLVQNRDEDLDTHFKGQKSYYQQQRFDFTGTIENLDSTIRMLESRFGQEIDPNLEQRNRTKYRKPLFRRRGLGDLLPAQVRSLRKLPQASELLTAAASERLCKRFPWDLERWNEASE